MKIWTCSSTWLWNPGAQAGETRFQIQMELAQAVNHNYQKSSLQISLNLAQVLFINGKRFSSLTPGVGGLSEVVKNFIVKTITCLLAKVLFQQTFLPLIPTCKRWQLWARKTQFLISISLLVFGWDIFMLRNFRSSNGRSMKYSCHECDDHKSLNEQ